MNIERIKEILQGFKKGSITMEKALSKLRFLPFEELDFATVDKHRPLRVGTSEVIYCPGKTLHQIRKIARSLASDAENILATRVTKEVYEAIKEEGLPCEYYPEARIVVINPKKVPLVGKIAVISAGTTDIPVAEEACVTAETLGNRVERMYDVGVAGIHRLLDKQEKFIDANVIIAVAGMEGALPSVVAGLVDIPVIAVPTSVGYGASFRGLTALLAMLNSCASGVSVVNIDNGFGAAYQASLINKKVYASSLKKPRR
jgi:hypothetical protein